MLDLLETAAVGSRTVVRRKDTRREGRAEERKDVAKSGILVILFQSTGGQSTIFLVRTVRLADGFTSEIKRKENRGKGKKAVSDEYYSFIDPRLRSI